MTVKEILKISATLIGREDIVAYLNGANQAQAVRTVNDVDVMVRLLNLVINELATSFVPMIATENKTTNTGRINYSELSHSPREIISAFDQNGNDRLLDISHTFIKVGSNIVDVEYSYFPESVELNDGLGYTDKDVPSRVLAYGLCAEFAISQGCFKDAVNWHGRYADAITELCSPKNIKIKRRVWQ